MNEPQCKTYDASAIQNKDTDLPKQLGAEKRISKAVFAGGSTTGHWMGTCAQRCGLSPAGMQLLLHPCRLSPAGMQLL